eukprot:GHVU01200020.1.p2 GENE.GHVU01200020.1~~GHVU01200020.1.p2  ORF type:complete len:118 (-),score=14.66 GHVU01200020.1:637-990(-)
MMICGSAPVEPEGAPRHPPTISSDGSSSTHPSIGSDVCRSIRLHPIPSNSLGRSVGRVGRSTREERLTHSRRRRLTTDRMTEEREREWGDAARRPIDPPTRLSVADDNNMMMIMMTS